MANPLDDVAWHALTGPHADLALTSDDGRATRYATAARLLWDDRYLYAAFECEDPDIWGTLTERDAHIYDEEVVEVFLDDDSDGVSYLEFEVSPRNVVLDLMVLTRGERTKLIWAWDCEGLQTAVHVDGTLDNRDDVDRAWSAENRSRQSERPSASTSRKLRIWSFTGAPPVRSVRGWSRSPSGSRRGRRSGSRWRSTR